MTANLPESTAANAAVRRLEAVEWVVGRAPPQDRFDPRFPF